MLPLLKLDLNYTEHFANKKMSINIAAEEFFDNVAANYDNLLKDPRFNAQHLNEAAKIFNRHNKCL